MLKWLGLDSTSTDTKDAVRILSEDFLKALYEQSSQEHPDLTLEGVCRQANTPQDKLAEVIGTLAIGGDIEVNPLRLTVQGKQRALSLVRAHRIYEKYLAEHSGYAPEEWHSQADKMEHNLGKEDKARIAMLLRNPLWDPHGDPIPTEGNHLPASKSHVATELQEGLWYKVLHIEDDNRRCFKEVSSTGLASGSTLRVLSVGSDRVSIFLEGGEYTLPREAVGCLTLSPLEDDDSSVLLAQSVLPLTQLKVGQIATIAALSPACVGAMRRRLMDLGFVRGSEVTIDMRSPMGNPTAYVVRHTAIALREDQARYILVENIQTLPEA